MFIYEHLKNILATQVVEELGSSVKEGLASLPTKEEVKDDEKTKTTKTKKRTKKTKTKNTKTENSKIKKTKTKKTKTKTKR